MKNTTKKPQSVKKAGAKEPEESKGIDFTQTNSEKDFDSINNEELISKPGQKANIVGDHTKLGQELPRADHAAPTIDLDEEMNPNPGGSNNSSTEGQWKQTGPGQQEEEPFNPEFHEMPEAEQDESSERTAIALVTAYAGLKLAVPKLVAISERKLKKMHKAGEVNMYLTIQRSLSSNERITIGQFVEEFNHKLIPAFQTSDEFKQAVIPLLTRILKKNGIALTDMQLLIFYVAQDLAATFQHAVIAMGDRREMLDYLRDMNATIQQQPVQSPVKTPIITPFSPVPAQTAEENNQSSSIIIDPKDTIAKIIGNGKQADTGDKNKDGKVK